jgi:signal transduction histidine kinase
MQQYESWGVGLAGMRERLRELDGELKIESDNSGTSLRAVPLSATRPFQYGCHEEFRAPEQAS